MNKKNNVRYLETEKKLENAFLELLVTKEMKNISITEICEKANVNRVTFYIHFESPEDILKKVEMERSETILNFFRNSDGIGKGFVRFFNYIRENRNFFREVIRLNHNFSTLEIILPKSNENSLDLESFWGTKEEGAYHSVFFRAGVMAIILRWLNHDCKESSEEMAKIIFDEYNVINMYKDNKSKLKAGNSSE